MPAINNKHILDSLKDAVHVVDKDFRILYQNEKSSDKNGNCIGRYCFEALSSHGQPCPSCLAPQVFKEKKAIQSPTPGQSGHCITNQARMAIPLTDKEGDVFAVVKTLHHSTKKEKLEEELAKSNALLRSILEATADGILVADPKGKTMAFNEKFTRLWSIPAETMVPYDEAKALEHVLDQLKEPDKFLYRINLLYAQKDQDSFDTLEFKDGRFFERYSKPLMIDEEIKGRVWSFRDVTEQKKLALELKKLATTDDLTELMNRRGFFAVTEQQLGLAKRSNKKQLLIYIDLDDLKKINDIHGHDMGDDAIVNFAVALESTFRESDVLARIGGDEFVVLQTDVANRQGQQLAIERLESLLKHMNAARRFPYHLSFSHGTALFDPAAPATIDELLKEADSMMYENKRNRKA